MKHVSIILSLIALCAAVTGCGPQKPADMPDVVPFKVKIVDGDKPIEGVHVIFSYDKNPVIAGDTNSAGIAEMTTTLQKYTAKGVPQGSFKVTCVKEPVVEHWKTMQEIAEMSPGESAAYYKEYQEKCAAVPREIPKSWGDVSNPVLTVDVDGSSNEVTFDVEGKANE